MGVLVDLSRFKSVTGSLPTVHLPQMTPAIVPVGLPKKIPLVPFGKVLGGSVS